MTGPGLRKLLMALIATVVAALGLVASADATFPGSNGPIAFTRGEGPLSAMCTDDIWSMQPDGTGQSQITNTLDCESGPAWSPNGGLIAFGRGTGRARGTQESADDPFTSCPSAPSCEGPTDWDGDLIVGSEHAPPSELAEGWPTWAPDGKSLVFVTASAISEASLVDEYAYPFGTSTPYSTGYFGDDPAFSPRGDAVAYTKFLFDGNGNTWYAIAVRNFASPEEDILTAGPASNYGATWSPDATRIAFARQPGDIWVMNADGTNQQQVTSGTEEDNFPAWSPDGTKMVFVRCCFTGGTTELFTVEPDGDNVTRLTDDSTNEWDPDWRRATATDPPGYPRAKAAMRVTVPLVPAYAQCQTPNREHGPPLASGSCAPPDQLYELRKWVAPAQELAGAAKQLHVLMNNCYADYGVRNAGQFAELLDAED